MTENDDYPNLTLLTTTTKESASSIKPKTDESAKLKKAKFFE